MIKRLMGTTALAAVTALASFGAEAQQRVPTVTVFGDSLSDPGNLAAFGQAPPPPYFGGRFSNGPVWAEQIGPLLGGATVTSRAFGGARSTAERPIDVQNQIAAHLAANPSLDSRGLYVVWIGANDYLQYFGAPSGDPTQFARSVAQNAANAANRLIQAGAREVLLVNLPNLGDTPGGRAGGPTASGQANQITLLHNAFLADAADNLDRTTAARVTLVDINTAFSAILSSPSTYGLNNVTIPCFTGTALTGACATEAGTNGTLFFDPIHPTRAGHAVTAQFFTGTLSAVIEAPEGIAARTQLGLAMHEAVQKAVQARLAGARSGADGFGATSAQTGKDDRVGVFVYGNYTDGERDPIDGQAGFDYDAYTVAIGADYRVSDAVLAGVSFGYGDGDQQLDLAAGSTDVNSWSLTAYFTAGVDAWYLDGSVSYSFEDYETSRATRFSFQPEAEAGTHGNSYGATLGGGYNFGTTTFAFGPTAELRYFYTEIDGYVEDNAGPLGLTVDQTDAESFVTSLGAQATARFQTGDTVIAPYIKGAWEHEFKNDARRVFVRLSSGQRGIAEPESGERNSFVGGAGLSVESGNLQFTVGYEGTLINSDRDDHSVLGRIRFGF